MATTLQNEAAAIGKIADTLADFSEEKACAIMCSVCAQLGHYAKAAEFARLAESWRDRAKIDAETKPKEA